MRLIDWETPLPSSPKEAPNRTRDEEEQLQSVGGVSDQIVVENHKSK
jgi:hypothetical protein